ncbi:MAG: polymorphic toxin type 28 domain-containing protein, partial [Halanaerobiales bacterium]|nr:polymorphic toxin type 28 domain-containing protein [Halanaerobiales bacterium]
EQVINPRSNNNTHIEKPNTSYNPITKSLKSFGEIAKGLWGAADERRKHALDSPYDFANYMTIGILDATWAGAKAKASKKYDSVYDFANWITIGTVDTFSGVLNPDELFSAEHWMDSLGAAAIVTGGIKMADKVAPGIVSVKDDIARVYDDLFKKKTMGAINLSRSQQKHINKLDNLIKNHLKETDFSGALRDLQGNPVPKPGGGYWNHLGEMQDTLTGLQRVQKGLKGSLKNPNLDSATRQFLQDSLDNATHYIQKNNDLGIK